MDSFRNIPHWLRKIPQASGDISGWGRDREENEAIFTTLSPALGIPEGSIR